MNSTHSLGDLTLPHSWQEAATLASRIPLPTILLCLAVLPLLSTTTLLLDAAPAAAPAMTNTFLAVGVTAFVGVVAWLLNRTIATFDIAVKKNEESVAAVTRVVEQLAKEQSASGLLIEYLKADVNDLKNKKESLEKSFAAIDKTIAVLLERHKKAD